jgi:hypothetical protein
MISNSSEKLYKFFLGEESLEQALDNEGRNIAQKKLPSCIVQQDTRRSNGMSATKIYNLKEEKL